MHEPAAGVRPPLTPAQACQWVTRVKGHAATLVEGWSDQAAVETLARRRGRKLDDEGVCVLAMGGVTNIDKFLQVLGPQGLNLRLAGLCDVAEEPLVRRALQRMRPGEHVDQCQMASLGFFVCDIDLEDELIRALGAPAVEAVVEAEGELASFRKFQQQPAQAGRSLEAHLHRFMGTRAGRKIRYGELLVQALPLAKVPAPLDRVLAHHP